MRNNREYIICRDIAIYLKIQYPSVIYHFDYAGLFHTKVQASRMKAIQGGRGWPDLFIAEPRGKYKGLFIEVKTEGTKLYKSGKLAEYITPHIAEQGNLITGLSNRDYYACFCCGFDSAKSVIDWYLKL